MTDLTQKKTTLFTVVPGAGTTAHGSGTDDAFLVVPGKESLGGIKITDDGKDLFVVNLNNRKLYRYDATTATASAPKAVYAIPDPGCPAAGDWRPFGLGLQDGVGYLGGVCSGESTGKLSTCARWSCPSTSPPERSARRCWISRWTTRVSPPLAVAHATARAGSPGPTPSRPPRTDRPARAIWPNQNRSWARSVSRPTAPCCWPSATASATAPRPVPRPTHPPTSCQAVTWTRHAWRAGCT